MATNPVRDTANARLAYVAAVRRLDEARERARASGVSLATPAGYIDQWTDEQLEAVRAVAQAWQHVASTKAAYDAALRTSMWPGH